MSQLFSEIFQFAAGAVEITAGVLTHQPELVAMGIGSVASGIGTILSGNHQIGQGTTVREPISPWQVAYGRCAVGGTAVYFNTWGQSNKFVDMVIVLASHPCEMGSRGPGYDERLGGIFPQVYADKQRLTVNTSWLDIPSEGSGDQGPNSNDLSQNQIDTIIAAGAYLGSPILLAYGLFADISSVINGFSMYGHLPGAYPGSGTTFSPTIVTNNIQAISRSGDTNNGVGSGVVTVVLSDSNAIPYLSAGDLIKIQGVGSGSNETLNGTFPVNEVLTQRSSGWTTSFTYLQGGPGVSITNQGQVQTTWPNYKNLINIEWLDGTQKFPTSSDSPWTTFQMAQLPIDDSAGNNVSNPWTNQCSLQNKTAVMLRMYFNAKYFTTGTYPPFSFRFRGKNNIYDPRHGGLNADGSVNPAYCNYTENPVLCIADFLTIPQEFGGYGAKYGTDIPLAELSAAASICDMPVPLAVSENGATTEPMYTLNGSFTLDKNRGEILQDMLTSCAGRISIVGGQFFINPGYWNNSYNIPQVDLMAMNAGPIEWKPATSIKQLYNGCKGTFLSPYAGYVTSDFPAYCQDRTHGYNGPSQYNGDILLAEDGGERRWLDLHLPFTNSNSMCQRIAKIELLRHRSMGTGTFVLNMAGWQFVPFDVISSTIPPPLNWNQKQLEVQNTRLNFHKVSNSSGQEVMLMATEVDVQEINSATYQWSVEEELSPAAYSQGSWSTQNYVELNPFPWSPGYAALLKGDALYGNAATFGLQQMNSVDAAGSPTTTLKIKGYVPFTPDLELSGPELTSVSAGTGGTLKSGLYAVTAASLNSSDIATQQYTEFLDIKYVAIPQDGGKITANILFGSGADGGALYISKVIGSGGGSAGVAVGTPPSGGSGGSGGGGGGTPPKTPVSQDVIDAISTDTALVWHWNQNLTPGGDFGQTTATITSYDPTQPGGSDPMYDHMELQYQEEIHGGCWANQAFEVTPTTIVVGGGGMTTGQWRGYTLSLLSRALYQAGDVTVSTNPELIPLNMPVVNSTASVTVAGVTTFTLTIGQNSLGDMLPDLTTLVNPGDVVIMRNHATFTANGFSDPNIKNAAFAPNGATNVEVGHLCVVLTGNDTGDVVPIQSVGSNKTSFVLAKNWLVTPATGDIVVIVSPSSQPLWSTPTTPTINGSGGPQTIVEPSIQNLAYQTWLINVRTLSKTGLHVPDMFSPYRDVFVPGSQGTRTIQSSTKMVNTDGIILANATAAPIVYTMLPFIGIPNQTLRVQKVDASANTVTITVAAGSGDLINGAATVVLTNQWDFTYIVVGGN